MIAAVAAVAFVGLAACGESAADKAAEKRTDALEAQAAATPNQAEDPALAHQNTPGATTTGDVTAPPN
jgi:hypothetical protein